MDFYNGQDVAGWLVSEKLDGVFARWSNGVLFNKEWRIISAPACLTAGKIEGEGEIWHPAGLQRVQACLAWSAADPRWEGVQFVPHASIPSKAIDSIVEVDGILSEIIARGGEGIVLRNPVTGELLKLKPSRDTEAEVLGYTDGSGRNPGIGSLVVSMNGKRFKLSIGLSNQDRLNPPPVGALVTFTFDGLTTRGLPRNARFLRVRSAA